LHDIELVVFDLDDTLYLEYDFLVGGFQAVATDLADRSGSDPRDHYQALMKLHRSACRDKFQDILTKIGLTPTSEQVDKLTRIYRTAYRPIKLLDDADRALARVRDSGIKTAVLTDGPLEAQQTKVNLLDLADRVDYVLCTAEHGRDFVKPSTKGFRFLAERFDAKPTGCVYIADNERKDFLGPNQLNWHAIKIKRANSLYSDYESREPTYRAAFTISSLDEIELVPR